MITVKVYTLELTNEGSFETMEQAEQWLHIDGLAEGHPPSRLGIATHPDTYKLASLVEDNGTPAHRNKLRWLHRSRPPQPFRRQKKT